MMHFQRPDEPFGGLNRYTRGPAEWKSTQDTEATAREVRDLVRLYGDKPTAAALASSHAVLVEIEKWKARCLKERREWSMRPRIQIGT
jgi:hypothetical protein